MGVVHQLHLAGGPAFGLPATGSAGQVKPGVTYVLASAATASSTRNGVSFRWKPRETVLLRGGTVFVGPECQ
jgi:hypothetical protein